MSRMSAYFPSLHPTALPELGREPRCLGSHPNSTLPNQTQLPSQNRDRIQVSGLPGPLTLAFHPRHTPKARRSGVGLPGCQEFLAAQGVLAPLVAPADRQRQSQDWDRTSGTGLGAWPEAQLGGSTPRKRGKTDRQMDSPSFPWAQEDHPCHAHPVGSRQKDGCEQRELEGMEEVGKGDLGPGVSTYRRTRDARGPLGAEETSGALWGGERGH